MRVTGLLLACGVLLACSSFFAVGQSVLGAEPKDVLQCDIAIVGGGPGGVYSAYRILEAYALNGTDSAAIPEVCLFEATGRVGGRVYSVRNLGANKDLVVDMGAYRYMPLAQPLITDLIQNLLQLPNRLYQPDVPDYKVVLTEDGSNAGFATYVEELFKLADKMGLNSNYHSKVTKLIQSDTGGFILTVADGTDNYGVSSARNVTAQRVILNLPTRPLHRLLQNSVLPDSTFNEQIYAPYVNRATKLYLYYDKAFWIGQGLTNGSLSYNQPWPPVGSAVTVPIIGRYYDAHAKCAALTGANGTVSASSVGGGSKTYKDFYYQDTNSLDVNDCYGYFQLTYTSDSGTTNTSHFPLDFLVDYQNTATPDVPYSVWDNTTYLGQKLLQDSHARLIEYHAVNKSINFPPEIVNALPSQAIVALWDASIEWSGGGWHSMKIENNTEYEYVEQAINPFPGLDLFVANEAYSTQLGWSEGSLVMAENIVRTYFDAPVPWWQRDLTASNVLFGSTFKDNEGAYQGGGELIRPPPRATSG